MKPTTMDELEHQHMMEIEELSHQIWLLRDALQEILESSSLPMAKAWADATLKITGKPRSWKLNQ